jgi:hypothetical protein
MAYDYDITEGLPYALSNPSAVRTYPLTGAAYDISINGLPFYVFASDETPYNRKTAQYRKDQVDQSREPGEQTLTGWWLRSQSSFHQGTGIKFYDPSAGETVQYRFTDSKGVNIWEKGKVTLLNSCSEAHQTTGPIAETTGRPQQFARPIQWKNPTNTGSSTNNTFNGVLFHDEYDVDKIYPTITATVTNKALTSNVATLTTSAAHGFAIGMEIVVAGVDATFNGTYTISTVPTTTTFTYAKTATNVTSTAATGTVTSNITHFVDYNTGAGVYPVYGLCDDGTTAYWVTNVTVGGSAKMTVYKKPLSGSAADTSDETKMFDVSGTTISNAIMEFVKERIVACFDNKVYEFTGSATTLPTALYTHPSTAHNYTSITASGPAIYIAGYNGIQSTIQKFTLSSAGAMPTLTSAVVAAELPVGEIVYKIYYYLGYMAIGTSKGIRIATVSDQDGSITYGPLIVETSQPCYDFTARDTYIWCATGVDGEPGLIRIDLSSEIETLRFAYANDIYYAGVTGHVTTACSFSGTTDQIAFATAYASATNGKVYLESASTLLSNGYITTGKIRYSTLEGKVFKFFTPRIDDDNGRVVIESVDNAGNEFVIGDFAEDGIVSDVSIGYPIGAQEFLSFKITLHRSATDSTKGAILNGYQIKALPAIPRQRILQYPLACYDNEKDKFGVQMGYENSSYERLTALETIENAGDTIRIDDFRTGESYTGIIEEVQFVNRTPPDKRFSGVGGVLYVTIRSL